MALPNMEVRVTADTAEAEAGFDRVTNAARNTGRNVDRMAANLGKASQQFRQAANDNGRLRASIQNTSYQIQDFAVQVAAGTSATRAMAQQLPQLLGGFGALGAVLGTVAAVAIPLTATLVDFSDVADEMGAVLERVAVTVGAVATAFAVKWVASMAAAKVATLTFAGALATLRKALIVTGIGAAVVAAGELIYQFSLLAKGAGSISKAFDLVAKAVGLSFQVVGAKISKFYFDVLTSISSGMAEIAEAIGAEGLLASINAQTQGFADKWAQATMRIEEFGEAYTKVMNEITALQDEAGSLFNAAGLFGGGEEADKAREEELAKRATHGESILNAERMTAERLMEIRRREREQSLNQAADTFGALQNMAMSFGKKGAKIAQVFGVAKALVSTFVGAAKALELPFPANMAAFAQVMATGLGAVASIRGVNTGGGSNSAGGGGRGAQAAPAQPKPLDVFISVLQPDDLISGRQVSSLFDKLVDEAGDRGIRPVFAT